MPRLLALLIGLALTLPVGSTHAAAPTDPAQVLTVSVTSPTSTTGVLQAWERRGDDFTRVRGPITVYVGEGGVGQTSERRSRTPRGVFTMTEAFGLARDPGSDLPYQRVGLSHWWVSDVQSKAYNQMRVCAPGSWCGFRQSRSEQLGAIDVYDYAIVMDYNRSPVVPGRGSAFFLHVSDGKPTQGCISMPRADIRWILRWLDPSSGPVISVDIADAAYDVLN